MLIVSDVHGAFEALADVAGRGQPLLVLGDLINHVDYRTMEGIAVDVMGRDAVERLVALRAAGRFDEARRLGRELAAGDPDAMRSRYRRRMEQDYEKMAAALEGATAFVTYGNVDLPDALAAALPPGCRFVDGETFEVEGVLVGLVGGGVAALGVPGEASEEEFVAKLDDLGPVDLLGTHVPPAVGPLYRDVIGGRPKSSQAILDYLREHQPAFHYFGDVHQPQAVSWRVGRTVCRNAGYFRATGRPVVHG